MTKQSSAAGTGSGLLRYGRNDGATVRYPRWFKRLPQHTGELLGRASKVFLYVGLSVGQMALSLAWLCQDRSVPLRQVPAQQAVGVLLEPAAMATEGHRSRLRRQPGQACDRRVLASTPGQRLIEFAGQLPRPFDQ